MQGDKVALKFIPVKKQAPDQVANEVRLLMTLRQINHPYVVRLDDVICIQDMIVLCMELAKGSLHDLHQFSLKERKAHLSPTTLIDLLEQAANGLDFLCTAKFATSQLMQGGIQHCDVKPTNLLLVGKTLKVADFGLAGRQGLQAVLGKLGTPYYAPPELYSGTPNARTDQFSLAVTYCYLRSGHYPYSQNPSAAPEGTPDLDRYPPEERAVLSRALQLRWIDRFSSCTEFIQSLRKATAK